MNKFEPIYSERTTHSDGDCVPICPHCKQKWVADDWYPADYETLETDCPSCGKPLLLVAQHRITIYACPESENAHAPADVSANSNREKTNK